jgi:hypothetical protein
METETNAQVRVLRELLDSKVLNDAQHSVVDRLLLATEKGKEANVAEFLDAMESAASFWALN